MTSVVLLRIFPFSDCIYGSVLYGTVKPIIRSKEKYGPICTSTVDRFCLFAEKEEVQGSMPGQNCIFCFSP